MKDNFKRIQEYMPWLLLLTAVDGFAALLLWIADVSAFRALAAVILLASLIMFAVVCAALIFIEKGREEAFASFLDNPDEYHEKLLIKAAGAAWADSIHLLGAALRERQNAYSGMQARLGDYEEYVEAWAHEIKVPLSLLTLLLDNHRDELSETIAFKLDYTRNRMQEFIDQMLFYARVKGTRKDYLFENIRISECIEEVLQDYYPLLMEKEFMIITPDMDDTVFTDRRGLRFILEQVISNAVKYSGEEPEIRFLSDRTEKSYTLCVQDNGRGVQSCDLPYIFEKGFTGNSGDDKKKATGMGLYLAGEIAKDLNISLEAASKWGEGFEMRLSFPVVTGDLNGIEIENNL